MFVRAAFGESGARIIALQHQEFQMSLKSDVKYSTPLVRNLDCDCQALVRNAECRPGSAMPVAITRNPAIRNTANTTIFRIGLDYRPHPLQIQT
jgi:hypothetical protein